MSCANEASSVVKCGNYGALTGYMLALIAINRKDLIANAAVLQNVVDQTQVLCALKSVSQPASRFD
jgi:hypothetical protein